MDHQGRMKKNKTLDTERHENIDSLYLNKINIWPTDDQSKSLC